MTRIFLLSIFFISLQLADTTAEAQQYKLRQSTNMMGMSSESTIYVKGMRKRSETKPMMGMPSAPVIIEQCDLRRFIKLNDKKKLYFIEPFAKEADEVIDEDVKPATTKTKPAPVTATSQKGGIINMWYNITDTGERKKMNGFTARHIWTTQKIKPSPDACMMKDSLIIKTDGWYIDLPQFNCPVQYTPSATTPTQQQQPECKDRYVTRRSGKGKLGFPLTETRIIIMGGEAKATEFSTSLETIEFTSLKLDSMLFEIPPGYRLVANESELQEKMSMQDMIDQYKKEDNAPGNDVPEQKSTGMIRIGVYEPQSDGQVQGPSLQQYLVDEMTTGKIEAVAVATEEDAKKLNCDYTLTTDFTKIKSGSKVGGLLKAIKNTDPNAASSFTIDATLTLKSLSGNTSPAPQTVSGKYDGKPDDAAKKALDEGSRKVISTLK